jgi:general secretion pathway protein B
MSFILDALKKSESDRQRQSGPALFEVRVAPPRTRLPLWAIAIAALLAVNLSVVMWMLLRHPARSAPAGAAAAPGAPRTAVSAPAPAAPPLSAGTPAVPPPPASAAAGTPPGASAASGPAAGAPPPSALPAVAAAAAAMPPPSGASGASPGGAAEGANPDDYAPAEEPAPGSLTARVHRGTAAGVPLYQDAAATPGVQIPALRLDLHVFAVRPQDRFVMINMHRLHEGDTLPEGVHVESITPEGAVLSYNGSRFLLPRE